MLETMSFPVVSVPVLSVKRMSMLPAVSIPTSRLTRTPERSIRFMFEESTTVIIIGSPSGTATTTMDIAIVKAVMNSGREYRMSRSLARAAVGFIPASIRVRQMNKRNYHGGDIPDF